MKKISLKEVKNSLKRDEMRAIIGGGCGDGRTCTTCYSAYDCKETCNSCRAGKCEMYE